MTFLKVPYLKFYILWIMFPKTRTIQIIEEEIIPQYVLGIITSEVTDFIPDPTAPITDSSSGDIQWAESMKTSGINAVALYVIKNFNSVTKNRGNNTELHYIYLSGTKIVLRYITLHSHCDAGELMKIMYLTKDKVDAYIIGEIFPKCATEHENGYHHFCNAISILSSSWNIPCLSWSCITEDSYPQGAEESSFHITTLPDQQLTVQATLAVLRHFKWRNIGVISTSSDEPWNTVCNRLENDLLLDGDFSLRYHQKIPKLPRSLNDKSFLNETFLNEMWSRLENSRYKALIFCLPTELSSTSNLDILKKIMTSLYEKMGGYNKAFIWIDPIGRFYDDKFLEEMKMLRNQYQKINITDNSLAERDKRTTKMKTIHSNDSTSTAMFDYTQQHFGVEDVLLSLENSNSLTYAIDNKLKRYAQNGEEPISNPRLDRSSGTEETESIVDEAQNTLQLYDNLILISPPIDSDFKPAIFDFVHSINLTLDESDFSPLYVYFADALALFLMTLQAEIMKKGDTIRLSHRIMNTLTRLQTRNRTSGLTTSLEKSVPKIPSYYLYNYLEFSSERNENVWTMVPMMEISTSNGSNFDKIKDKVPGGLVWSTQGKPVPDTDCDINDILCHVTTTNLRVIDVFIALFGVTLLYIIAYGTWKFSRKKIRNQDARGSNKLFLSQADLQLLDFGSQVGKSKKVSMDFGSNISRLGSTITLAENATATSVGENVLASLDGEIVFIKRLEIVPPDNWKTTEEVLRVLRELRHENICYYYGLFCGSSLQGLVMEYCSRKSFRDLILNRDYKLDSTFKISLIHDLVKGMKYLHSSILKCHGRLKSSNCLVDSRFVLKITDYGVNNILSSIGRNEKKDEDCSELLWTAPELLNNDEMRRTGTQKGDCYSFAIICQEVFSRGTPFCNLNLSDEEIIQKIKNAPPTIRPTVTIDSAPPEIIQVMKQCWQQQPELRLTFSVINAEIKRMNRGNKHNIVENMMKQLEEYSSHLEELVMERTAELDEEKKKTEQLLMRMMPPSAAKMLMANQYVVPETFEDSTIYFSDICGFTTISVASTPMQVVDLLNDLYTCFDAVIEKYEVYKVETIGDAYMVASGIPNCIGDRHATEAALMSLDIMSATTTFRIRHLPTIPLRIRIGLHSGSAVAGVVGLTMPRYCLFGDTINTASRVESTGIPCRIHVSDTTKMLLDKSKMGFQTERRGVIELKGRGDMTTYWLLGKDGYDKPMPVPADMTGPSHGIALEDIKKAKAAPNSDPSTNTGEAPKEEKGLNTGGKDLNSSNIAGIDEGEKSASASKTDNPNKTAVTSKTNTNNSNNLRQGYFQEHFFNLSRRRIIGPKKTSVVKPLLRNGVTLTD